MVRSPQTASLSIWLFDYLNSFCWFFIRFFFTFFSSPSISHMIISIVCFTSNWFHRLCEGICPKARYSTIIPNCGQNMIIYLLESRFVSFFFLWKRVYFCRKLCFVENCIFSRKLVYFSEKCELSSKIKELRRSLKICQKLWIFTSSVIFCLKVLFFEEKCGFLLKTCGFLSKIK